jgi:PIN domain nuclease of toxin-antitoxin system
MIRAIADTHAVIWYLYSDPRLGREASALIDQTVADGDFIGVSAISLAEMVYLMEKGRLPSNVLMDTIAAIVDSNTVLKQIAVHEAVVLKMNEVPRNDIPDLPDRIIAATARYYDVPILSRDRRIRSSSVQSIW